MNTSLLDMESLAALGESLYADTSLAAGHDGMRRSIRLRRVVRGAAVGTTAVGATVVLGLAIVNLLSAAQGPLTPSGTEVAGEGASTPEPTAVVTELSAQAATAAATSALRESAQPWSPDALGQSFIECAPGAPSMNDPSANEDGETMQVTMDSAAHCTQYVGEQDLISAHARLTVGPDIAGTLVEFEITNISGGPLLLNDASTLLNVLVPGADSEGFAVTQNYAYGEMSDTATLSEESRLESWGMSVSGNESLMSGKPEVSRTINADSRVLAPGETFWIREVHADGYVVAGAGPVMPSLSESVRAHGNAIVLTVQVELYGQAGDSNNGFLLVQHNVGSIVVIN